MTATTLPDLPWRRDPAILRVLDALGAEQARAVGGAVRDSLYGAAVSDIDLATPLSPDVVTDRLMAAGIKVVPTGIAHGTVTAVVDGRPFEVTTLRRDVATDGRRATVAFSTDWAEDAARRDFTINAIYADPVSGALYDPVGGVADLAARHVRFIGDAGQRIDEDHLRILRYFRFLARFGGGVGDGQTLAVIADRAASLRSLSRERIADELSKLLALPDPAPAIAAMTRAGLFTHIAPDVGEGGAARVAAMVAAEQAAGLTPDYQRRLIALLPADPALADGVAAKLKLSNRFRKRLAAARGAAWAGLSPRALAYRLGVEGAMDRALLGGAAGPMLAALDGWGIPQFPVRGGDVIAAGITPGPDVARALAALEQRWVDADFPETLPVSEWLDRP